MKESIFSLFKKRCRKCGNVLIKGEPKKEWTPAFGTCLVTVFTCSVCDHTENTAREIN
ncbi:MAG: hypothetical protein WC514_01530 [Candidatus Paceibacterota bacterium]